MDNFWFDSLRHALCEHWIVRIIAVVGIKIKLKYDNKSTNLTRPKSCSTSVSLGYLHKIMYFIYSLFLTHVCWMQSVVPTVTTLRPSILTHWSGGRNFLLSIFKLANNFFPQTDQFLSIQRVNHTALNIEEIDSNGNFLWQLQSEDDWSLSLTNVGIFVPPIKSLTYRKYFFNIGKPLCIMPYSL